MSQTGLIPLKKKLKNLELQVSNVPVHFFFFFLIFFIHVSDFMVSIQNENVLQLTYIIYIETWNISPQNNM